MLTDLKRTVLSVLELLPLCWYQSLFLNRKSSRIMLRFRGYMRFKIGPDAVTHLIVVNSLFSVLIKDWIHPSLGYFSAIKIKLSVEIKLRRFLSFSCNRTTCTVRVYSYAETHIRLSLIFGCVDDNYQAQLNNFSITFKWFCLITGFLLSYW